MPFTFPPPPPPPLPILTLFLYFSRQSLPSVFSLSLIFFLLPNFTGPSPSFSILHSSTRFHSFSCIFLSSGPSTKFYTSLHPSFHRNLLLPHVLNLLFAFRLLWFCCVLFVSISSNHHSDISSTLPFLCTLRLSLLFLSPSPRSTPNTCLESFALPSPFFFDSLRLNLLMSPTLLFPLSTSFYASHPFLLVFQFFSSSSIKSCT